MNLFKRFLTGFMIVFISSCAQREYVDVKSSGIKHSGSEVISLYKDKKLPEKASERFFSKLLDEMFYGMIGSDPDEEDCYDRSS